MEPKLSLQTRRAGLSIWSRWQEAVQNISTSGFIPKPFPPMQRLASLVTFLWVFLQVGKVSFVGAENLEKNHRLIVTPNHSSYFDPLVVISILPRPARYMAAYDQFSGLGGLRAVIMAATGAFAVDRSKGRSVVEPSIKMLHEAGPQTTLVVFPEGRINHSLGQFKSGAARIGLSCKNLIEDEEIAIVPVSLFYNKRDDATDQGGYERMGFKWRGGVTVTALAPIYLRAQSHEEITAAIRKAIELDLDAKRHK